MSLGPTPSDRPVSLFPPNSHPHLNNYIYKYIYIYTPIVDPLLATSQLSATTRHRCTAPDSLQGDTGTTITPTSRSPIRNRATTYRRQTHQRQMDYCGHCNKDYETEAEPVAYLHLKRKKEGPSSPTDNGRRRQRITRTQKIRSARRPFPTWKGHNTDQ